MRVAESRMLEAFVRYIKQYKVVDIPVPEVQKKLRDYKREMSVLEKRREKLQQMYADDFMTYLEFKQQMKENDSNLDQLKEDMSQDTDEAIDERVVQEMMWQLSDNFEELTKEEKTDFLSMFVNKIDFTRTITKYDKNGVPKQYEYTITNVLFNRL